ncbi:unnamed protein product [Paramecium pentaurelia]|uniref:Protein farnesyltransferase/geranylgeranyltransferase type-1 subunit alpha n=1 Tax=Paramecium pentaurelia TaxID=43138 RepID=A0A8S1S097_9CILI|nr:unnamed protein product [Paramecium pentaurelia]
MNFNKLLWSDVERTPQFTSKIELLNVKYDEDYEEIMDYFRAIVKSGEISERVFDLTSIIIQKLPSNYNAYFIRRKCLKQMNLDLSKEMEFINEVTISNQKVYQIWEHRRQVIEQLNNCKGEIEFLHKIFDEDNKNYHGWSYRVWLCEKFNLYAEELIDVQYYLDEDIGNNSAWNYRYFLLSKIPFDFNTELEYIKNAIRIKDENEASWNYLRGWFKTFKFKNDQENPYKTFIQYNLKDFNLIEFLNEIQYNNRFALSLRIQCLLQDGKYQDAISICEVLQNVDSIRIKYWQYLKTQINGLIQ